MEKEVLQFALTSWPDHGTPDHPGGMLLLRNIMRLVLPEVCSRSDCIDRASELIEPCFDAPAGHRIHYCALFSRSKPHCFYPTTLASYHLVKQVGRSGTFIAVDRMLTSIHVSE